MPCRAKTTSGRPCQVARDPPCSLPRRRMRSFWTEPVAGPRQDLPRALEHRVIDELAIELESRQAACLSRDERVVHAACARDFFTARAEDLVHDRQLARVNNRLALKSELSARPGTDP